MEPGKITLVIGLISMKDKLRGLEGGRERRLELREQTVGSTPGSIESPPPCLP